MKDHYTCSILWTDWLIGRVCCILPSCLPAQNSYTIVKGAENQKAIRKSSGLTVVVMGTYVRKKIIQVCIHSAWMRLPQSVKKLSVESCTQNLKITLLCFNIGTTKIINFSFGENGKLMALGDLMFNHFRVSVGTDCPYLTRHYALDGYVWGREMFWQELQGS